MPFPAIRAEAKKAGATVYFADEAGIRSDYHAGTTWAPVGQTPVVKATGARHGLNMISAVTAQGLLRFSTFTGGFTAARFIEFCKKLIHDTSAPVYLVVDGHPAHRAKAVKEFVASTDGRLRLFVLPAYSPQLNPDEWVWKNVKHDRVGRTSGTGPEQFKAKVISALRRLQKIPAIVRAFFSDPDLRYITAPTNDLLSTALTTFDCRLCARARNVPASVRHTNTETERPGVRFTRLVGAQSFHEVAQQPGARRVAQFRHRLGLDLPDPLAGHPVHLADLVQRAGPTVGEAEPQAHDAGLALGQ